MNDKYWSHVLSINDEYVLCFCFIFIKNKYVSHIFMLITHKYLFYIYICISNTYLFYIYLIIINYKYLFHFFYSNH